MAVRSLQETKVPFENSPPSTGLYLLQEPEQMFVPSIPKQLWRRKLEKGLFSSDHGLYEISFNIQHKTERMLNLWKKFYNHSRCNYFWWLHQESVRTNIYLTFSTDGINDRDYFADLLTKEMRLWTETSFRSSLVNTRTVHKQSDIIQQLYDTFRSKVAAVDPDNYLGDLTLSRLIAQKSVQH